MHALHCEVLEAIALGRPLDCVIDLLCRRIEALAPATMCSVLMVDEEGRLHPLAGPGLPDAYSRALDGVMIGPEVGSCGSAAFHGHAVEVHDIDADPRWTAFKAMPLSAGLRACWSSPVKGHSGAVIGAFAFYYRECWAPRALERGLVSTSVHLCALAIEHDMVRSRLERTNQRFDIALSNMSQGLCFFDGGRKLIVANRRYGEIYNLDPDSIVPGTSLKAIVELRVAAGSGPKMAADAYLNWRDAVQDIDKPNDTVVELANGRVIAIHTGQRLMPAGSRRMRTSPSGLAPKPRSSIWRTTNR